MKARDILCALFVVAFSSVNSAQAGEYDHCQTIITSGLRDYNISKTSEGYLNTVYDRYCEVGGNYRSSSSHSGLDVIADILPFSFTQGESSSEGKFRSFCKNYSASLDSHQEKFDYSSKTVSKAYDSFIECIRFASLGAHIKHSVVSLEASDIFLSAGRDLPIEIQGVVASKNISCSGHNPKGKLISYDASTRFAITRALGFTCRRIPRESSGSEIYDEGTVQVLTNIGNYDIFYPRDERLPEAQASAIQTRLDSLMMQMGKANDRINGIKLQSTDAGKDEFACGGQGRNGGALVFMDGSRDGTGCGITNLNFYKRLELVVPPAN